MSFENKSPCPSTETLAALSAGKLGEDEAARTEAHLDACDECCGRLEAIGAAFLTKLLPDDRSDRSVDGSAADSPALRRAIEELRTEIGTAGRQAPASEVALLDLLDRSSGREGGLGMLGPYEIREEVARGGMGIVLKGYDRDLERTVAIKALAPALASVPQFREAFLFEARAAARLLHENIMPIYAVDQQGEIPYLVMPFVEGANLQDHLDREGALEVEEAVRIAHQLGRALEAAHAERIVHGDLKPGNVMLLDGEGDRRVWLADFGLARAADDPESRLGGSGAGVLAGTPGFMAPEQVAGEVTDHRADLFALGCVLFSMLNGGRSPFHAGAVEGALVRVEPNEPPSLRAEVPGVPDWLDRLVARLLKTNPAARPQSATEVRELLERHLPDNRPASRRSVVLGVGVLAVGAVLAAMLLKPAAPERAEPLPEGFLVGSGKDASLYSTLEEAIQAVPAGGTVVVRKSGELEIEPIAIPAGKALTIRAAAGHHPIFVARSWRTSVLETDSPLCLEGLEFRHPFADLPREAAPILYCRGKAAFLANCRFVRSTAELQGERKKFGGKPLVRFDDCLQIEISGCEFYTRAGTAIAVHVPQENAEASVRASNNLLAGQVGFRLESPGSCRHSWRLERSTVAASNPFTIRSRGNEFLHLDLVLERNLFDFLNTFLELRTRESVEAIDQAVTRISLQGSGNLYRPTGRLSGAGESIYAMLTGTSGGAATIDRIATFEEFTAMFGRSGRELPEPVFDWKKIESYRGEFSLMTAELYEPAGLGMSAGEEVGFDRGVLGPGEAFDRWKETEARESWSQRVDAAF